MDRQPAGPAPKRLVGEPIGTEERREHPVVELLLVTADVEGALALRNDGVGAARQPGLTLARNRRSLPVSLPAASSSAAQPSSACHTTARAPVMDASGLAG